MALFFFATAWLFLFPIITARVWWAGVLAVIAGVVLAAWPFRGTIHDRFDARYVVFIPLLVLAALLIGFPYNLGPVMIALGLAAGCAVGSAAWAGMGLIVSGVVLSLQSASLPLYTAFASRYHGAGWLTGTLNLLLRILGSRTAPRGDMLYVGSNAQVFPFGVSWEKLGLLFVVLALVGGIAILLLTRARKRNYAYLLLIVAGYALLREAFMLLAFADAGELSVFWSPVVTSLTFLPLFFLLAKAMKPGRLPRPAFFTLDRRFWLTASAAFLCVAFLVGAWGFHDPGIRKRSRVIVDEKHSNWEWTTEKFDTTWYGQRSGYNYNSLYTFLDSHYYMERNFDPITDLVLEKCDVLVIKPPTAAFTAEEISAIEAFVHRGGGLFLIGDHTNVFGTSSFINPLAASFGLRFKYDATYGLGTGALTEYDPPTFMPHPVVRAMPHMLFATSSTLEVPLNARGVITGYGMEENGADYSRKSFFPEDLETAATGFGSFTQAAALSHGRGRVLAFADSTVFSNFWMFMPGKPELALGAVEWLNRVNSSFNLSVLFASLGLAFLVTFLYLSGDGRRKSLESDRAFGLKSVIAPVTVGLLAFGLVSVGVSFLDKKTYAPPPTRKPVTLVGFDLSHSDMALPTSMKGFSAAAAEKYSTFFVWNQRLGYFPKAFETVKDAVGGSDLVVMINPQRDLTAEDRTVILDYVKGGGALLILSGQDGRSIANRLTGPIGMRLNDQPIGHQVIDLGDNNQISTTGSACSVEGGHPVLVTAEGNTVLAVKAFGKGKVAMFSDSSLFSDAQMGDTSVVPDQRQKGISELEFRILREMIEGP